MSFKSILGISSVLVFWTSFQAQAMSDLDRDPVDEAIQKIHTSGLFQAPDEPGVCPNLKVFKKIFQGATIKNPAEDLSEFVAQLLEQKVETDFNLLQFAHQIGFSLLHPETAPEFLRDLASVAFHDDERGALNTLPIPGLESLTLLSNEVEDTLNIKGLVTRVHFSPSREAPSSAREAFISFLQTKSFQEKLKRALEKLEPYYEQWPLSEGLD